MRGLKDGEPWIQCEQCDMPPSYHPKDVQQGYCGKCHDWTSKQMERDPQCSEAVKAAVYDYLRRTGEAHLCPPV